MAGWIKLHRAILDWGWYSDPVCRAVFMHLLLIANHDQRNWRGHTIEKGQAPIGRKELAKTLGFGEQQIRRALSNLETTSEITIKTHSKFSLITIVNWDAYQHDNQQNNQQPTSNQPATNQQPTTLKEVKNKRNKEYNTSSRFEEFWKAYPRHEGKKAAQRAYERAPADHDTIMKGLEASKRKWDDPKFIPHAATWLNGERWQDEQVPDKSQPTADGERQAYEWHKKLLAKGEAGMGYNIEPEYRLREKIAEYEAKHEVNT